MNYTVVTMYGDEYSFASREAATSEAIKIAERSGSHVEVYDESAECCVFVTVQS